MKKLWLKQNWAAKVEEVVKIRKLVSQVANFFLFIYIYIYIYKEKLFFS